MRTFSSSWGQSAFCVLRQRLAGTRGIRHSPMLRPPYARHWRSCRANSTWTQRRRWRGPGSLSSRPSSRSWTRKHTALFIEVFPLWLPTTFQGRIVLVECERLTVAAALKTGSLSKAADCIGGLYMKVKNAKVVVCGAGGFIGGHLVKSLFDNGADVIRAGDVKPLDEGYQASRGVAN